MEHAMPLSSGEARCYSSPQQPGLYNRYRTTDRVLQILLKDDLSRVRADSIA